MKLTEWYSGDQKPVRVGVYEKKSKNTKTQSFYHFWDGERWFGGWYTVQRAIADQEKFKILEYCDDDEEPREWRGIAK